MVALVLAGVHWAGALFSSSDSPLFVEVHNVPPTAVGKGSILQATAEPTSSGKPTTVDITDTYIVPESIEHVGAPPSPYATEWTTWIHALGGSDAGETNAEIDLQASPSRVILVRRVAVEILDRFRSPRGTLLSEALSHVPCQRVLARSKGGLEQYLFINLDDTPPTISATDPTFETLRAFTPFTLGGTDSEFLMIRARAMHARYRWRLRIGYLVDGVERESIVDSGLPFDTAPRPAGPVYRWFSERRPYGWYRCTN